MMVIVFSIGLVIGSQITIYFFYLAKMVMATPNSVKVKAMVKTTTPPTVILFNYSVTHFQFRPQKMFSNFKWSEIQAQLL